MAATTTSNSSGGGNRIWTSSLAVLALAVALVSLLSLRAPPPPPPAPGMADDLPTSVHDISVKDIKGNDVKLSEYDGKVLLIVNVASKCGLTNSNYKELNILYEKYKEKGLEILAFPCNQFAGQEPGSNEEIEQTVCSRFKAEFPIFDKIDVNGKEAAPLYKFLKSQKGGFLGDGIKWNFTKFLVGKDGKVIERYAPTTSPLKIKVTYQGSVCKFGI
uniref:Glutathione peroxidase n=1 Tax=Oryza glumipatula TaxID=40148 RepID=A0A0E0BHR8_9ORYZ